VKYALVRVEDDAPDPAGLIGWYRTSPPRRYAHVVDPGAFGYWVRQHYPDQLEACGHPLPAFERTVRDAVAADGYWVDPRSGEILHPPGVRLGTDGDMWLDVTMPTGHTWASPARITDLPPERLTYPTVASMFSVADARRPARDHEAPCGGL
jgi:hypothetical protein